MRDGTTRRLQVTAFRLRTAAFRAIGVGATGLRLPAARPRAGQLRASRLRATALAAGLLVLAVGASGCGLESASAFQPKVEPGSIKPVKSLDGARIAVGSKDFTEQIILGKIAVLALTAAGAKVVDKTNIKGSVNSRRAQERGDIDLAWEYTGTAWITYLGQTKPIPDAGKQYTAVRDLDRKKHQLVWLPPARFDNTYAFATTKEKAAELGITKMSQLADLPKDKLTFCVESEFASRDDGLRPALETYDLPLGAKVPKGNIKSMDTGVIYSQVDRGSVCTFGEVFTTDGRIPALGLSVLQDDRHFFPVYNPSVVVRENVLAAHPEIREIFAEISRRLDTTTMQRLNAQVDVKGSEPSLVAKQWLVDEGFVR